MALSVSSNIPVTKSTINQEKPEPTKEQIENKGSGLSSDKNSDDTVSLGQAAGMSASQKAGETEVIDAAAAEELLPRTMKAILSESKTAVSAQANIENQVALDYLAG